MAEVGRREFLKFVGLTGTSALVGCSPSSRRLIEQIAAPEDLIPGRATWYATTCRECPAGCGLLAKNVDGRIIKAEGNPLHPINRGKLCVRGQASLHGLYNPDRYPGPLQRKAEGGFDPLSWEQGEALLVRRLRELVQQGRGDRIVFVSELMTGTLRDLVTQWLAEMGQSQGPVLYEAFAYEPLRKANQLVFGIDGIPTYRINRADFLISFGAGFLETWLSNIDYARRFASFHAPHYSIRHAFVYVGPRLSVTAANADQWMAVAPGDEYLVAVAMLRVILEENLAPQLPLDQRQGLADLVNAWTLDRIVTRTGVAEQRLRSLARRFARAERPLALAEGLAPTAPHATATAVAANLLCAVHPGALQTLDFGSLSAYGEVTRTAVLEELAQRLQHDEVDLLFIHQANPLYGLPPSWNFAQGMEQVPLVVSFSSAVDETSAKAQLILPTHTPLESWGDHEPRQGVCGLMQPVMGPVFDTRHLGDVLLSIGKQVRGAERFPWEDFFDVLQHSWQRKWQAVAPDQTFEAFWNKALASGGLWEKSPRGQISTGVKPFQFSFPEPGPAATPDRSTGLQLTIYPTVQFFDGRGANRPWLQELPDPITQTTWGGWLEIHPETAARLGIQKGDLLLVKTDFGAVEVPALPINTVPPGTVALPVGQGHRAYGRFADGHPANPWELLPGELDILSEGIARPALGVSIEKLGTISTIANTDGSFYDHGRGFVQTMDWSDYQQAAASGYRPHLHMPLPEGYDPASDFYPPHQHKDYRWCMVVDLDRCIGCGACVVACYAENNVAIVGREQVIKGREMSWLRVQRYFDPHRPAVLFLPMLCQHCDSAPCEAVCPVYAPHHSEEGLNNQVYNRCFGTRFCLQNDPYKVRRFNWFTFTRPAPLTWQLNPEVTVRQKGVMEKCSFCIQRIVYAKQKARNQGRKVQEGDFTTACAQTCPADALIFGNLLDPESRVTRLFRDARAFQVLAELNTKPAVVYLKRVTGVLV
jgi:anaerobic selenocysteine-containing dehydrogenase/Fe-S-cluster-containing dehydrogenase component